MEIWMLAGGFIGVAYWLVLVGRIEFVALEKMLGCIGPIVGRLVGRGGRFACLLA